MKRFIVPSVLFTILLCFTVTWAGTWDTNFPEVTTPVVTDLLLIESDPSGTPATSYITTGSLPINILTQAELDLKLNTADLAASETDPTVDGKLITHSAVTAAHQNVVTIGTANGLSVDGSQIVSLVAATNANAGAATASHITDIEANTSKVTNATHDGDVTGSETLTIANDAVDIAHLSAIGAAGSDTFLRGDNVWDSPGAAGGDTQVQYNDLGALAGDAGLTYNDATDALTIGSLGVQGATYGVGLLSSATATASYQLFYPPAQTAANGYARLYNTDGTSTFSAITGGHDAVTIGTANGLSLSTQVLSLAAATNATAGAATAAQITAIEANTAKTTNATHSGDVAGDTTLTIAVDAVDIPMLSATGTAGGTTYLRGDNTWSTPAGTGDLLSTNNLSDVDSASTSFDNIKQPSSTTATGAVELATDAETITGTDTARAITPANLEAKFTDGIEVSKLTVTASPSPSIVCNDSDNAAGTCEFYANSSGGVNDIILSIGVEDSTGESTEYMQVDGVSETVDFLKYTVLQVNDIISSEIDTIVDSIVWNAAGTNSDGTNCADPAEVTLNSGPVTYTTICTDNDASTIYGHVVMPDSWNAGTITMTSEYTQTAADTNALNGDIACMCRGAGETINNTWGTEIAIDDAAVTGSNTVDHTTSAAMTCDGTCAGGDTLFWRYQVDATGTTTSMATLNYVGWKVEYTSNVGD